MTTFHFLLEPKNTMAIKITDHWDQPALGSREPD
jgi:hypothetical protein